MSKKLLIMLLTLTLVVSILTPTFADGIDEDITVMLDNTRIHPAEYEGGWLTAHIKDGRTMVPVRFICLVLGADIEWQAESKIIVITRAGNEVKMQIDCPTAYLNDLPFQMDVSPYILNDRTYIPARYISEFFNQTVTWNENSRTVNIQQDKSKAKGSNLENWALTLAAYYNFSNSASDNNTRLIRDMPLVYGECLRHVEYFRHQDNLHVSTDDYRKVLYDFWGVNDRKSLIDIITRHTDNGHNSAFLNQVKSKDANELDRYLYQKWGETGIIAWDAYRMSMLAQYGYHSGYLTYEESLKLIEPSAKNIQKHFDNWHDANENYIDGYLWWSSSYPINRDPWQTERGQMFTQMATDTEISVLFDDDMFTNPIISLKE